MNHNRRGGIIAIVLLWSALVGLFAGSASGQIPFLIADVITEDAVEVKTTSARLQGRYKTNRDNYTYFRYRPTARTSKDSTSDVAGSSEGVVETPFSRVLTGLTPNTQYAFQAVLRYSFFGWHTKSGEERTLFTLPNVPQLSIPTNMQREANALTAFAWQAPTPGGASTYELQIALDAAFTRIILSMQSIQTTNVTLSRPVASNTLYYWRVRAVNADGGVGSWTSPFSFTTTGKALLVYSQAFPDEPKSTTEYRLVGVPGKTGGRISMFIAGAGDQKYDWRVYRDDGSSFREQAGGDTLPAGEGVWLIRKGAFAFSDSVAMPSLTASGTFAIGLHAGWNIISNPFDRAVSWGSIQSANATLKDSAFTYQGNGFTPTLLLEPFKGYYFKQDKTTRTSLSIPYSFSAQKQSAVGGVEPLWQLRIAAGSDLNTDESNAIGILPTSSQERDDFDSPKPPLVFDQTFVCFSRPEWDREYPNFRTDYRPALGSGQSWDFEVSNPRLSTTTVTISGIASVPAELDVVLLNLSNTGSCDIRMQNSVSFSPAGKITKFRLLVGNKEFVQDEEREFVPSIFFLDQNFPNPFNPSTTIRFGLAALANVDLVVYNALGQKVAQLVEGQLGQGYHEVRFNAAGCASGVYILRLHAGSFVETRRMLLLR